MVKQLEFFKYHGAGNDFVMFDCRIPGESAFTTELVKFLCDRHIGIGADGLILLLNDDDAQFRMKYFNSDGKEGTMCGNGGRCIVEFAKDLGLINETANFKGIDGLHKAIIKSKGIISLQMIDVKEVEILEDGYFLNTGSPHFVTFRENVSSLNVFEEGRAIRHQPRFGKTGSNVNFVQTAGDNYFIMRTFERGVENETLACGTGTVASAISSYIHKKTDKSSYTIDAPGGTLKVSFTPHENGTYSDVWLEGPVKFVFKGEILIDL